MKFRYNGLFHSSEIDTGSPPLRQTSLPTFEGNKIRYVVPWAPGHSISFGDGMMRCTCGAREVQSSTDLAEMMGQAARHISYLLDPDSLLVITLEPPRAT